MWFYILLLVLVVLVVWWLTRTSLFRHWRRHAADPAGERNRGSDGNIYGGGSGGP